MPTELIVQLVLHNVPFDYDPICQTITLRHVTDSEVEAFEANCKQLGVALCIGSKVQYIITDLN